MYSTLHCVSDDVTYTLYIIDTTIERYIAAHIYSVEINIYTLVQSYKRTPNSFYASSKSKNQLMYFSISINKPRLRRGSKSYFISKRRIRLARTKSE